ncbi:hypothetical protein HELRODRAFT_185691 [Helobdella robusta]|uniref:Cilia- and flagella-associated protein 298 n=1 Tax=Helobdella robusta TaxID=6412 RepID=T1FN56_HELRO|nr:hypothetical protein HELRODRAFT_185691 [Helobdella robusta]ESO01593.1 hypothetical protein HELRODRAFT_185691 [Helobdella robusta]
MVKLQVKKGDDNQFLFETSTAVSIDELTREIVQIYNKRLKVHRICGEVEELADHGISLPPNMQGLTDDQIEELKLVDEWANISIPSGGPVDRKDDIGRRNGKAPNEQMSEILKKTSKEAKDMISKKKVDFNECLTEPDVSEAIQILKGATMIVYPMGLPPHDPVRMELEDREDLSGTQASLDIMDPDKATLYWAGKELLRNKLLSDFIGTNEKTKLIVKLQKSKGVPAREPVVTEKEQKEMMAYYYRRQEEMKKLEECTDDSYYDSNWADNQQLKRHFQGLNNIQFKPGKKL